MSGVVSRFKTSLKAQAAALRFGRPSKKTRVILVVGQDGGGGTISFLASILRVSGAKVGIATRQYVQIGPDKVMGSDQADINSDVFRLQGLLAQMKRAKCHYALIEVPPELPAHQFIGLKPAMLIVRRCGDDYLDDSTLKARLAMLSSVLDRRPDFIVFNSDDSCRAELLAFVGQEGVISFGAHAKAECRITDVAMNSKAGAAKVLIDHQTEVRLTTSLVGKQAIYNAVAATAAAYVLRVPIEVIEKGVEALPQQAGLFEYIPLNRPFELVLDASSTPAGIAETLETLKHFAKNRLIVVLSVPLGVPASVWGQLGEISATYADRLFVCDGEYAADQQPGEVRKRLIEGAGMVSGEAKTEEIANREAAIEKAVAIARRGDMVVVVAVTQHGYRQLGNERVTWSDRGLLKKLLDA